MLAQHSSITNEAYTPAVITEPARAVLGAFDLDPASCELGQQQVKATRFYSENGLFLPWAGRVFLNPPGGKLHPETLQPFIPGKGWSAAAGLSSAAVWWANLHAQWVAGCVESAIYVCFSLSVFRTAQAEGPAPPYMFPMCVPSMRINYDKVVNGLRVPTKEAPADTAIIFLPPRGVDNSAQLARFEQHFTPLGRVRL